MTTLPKPMTEYDWFMLRLRGAGTTRGACKHKAVRADVHNGYCIDCDTFPLRTKQ